jgi:light-regulated signal transduction histidine kinase (bacteriophytochrome)
VILFVLLYLGFQRTIVRPILRLAREVRTVTDEDIRHRVEGDRGPRELVELAADIEAMRQRIVDEVSKLHQAHELLDARTQELQRSNSDLEQFAYVASHDLQEPLRAVVSYLQLLQRHYQGRLDERADKYIGYAVEGGRRMQQLINDLLAFSRVGRQDRALGAADGEAALARALANLRAAIAESGAQVTHEPLPTVRADATQLEQLLQNLVSNALKFRGREAPRVHVWAERLAEERAWRFGVRDNGIGIAPEHRERIFGLFQRLHGRGEYPGTGLGLAICRKVAERHGGRLWVESEHGQGATFFFTLTDQAAAA